LSHHEVLETAEAVKERAALLMEHFVKLYAGDS
jgi:hypothetical protein